MTKCNDETFADAFNMLCGDKIGEGIHRTVYECSLVPGWVVKVENAHNRYFANVFENRFWNDNRHNPKVAKWLAPCGNLSPDGRVMLQKRVDPLPVDYDLPPTMPAFLCDFKPANYGLINGQIVCVDYAITIENPSLRMIKTDWRV